jgi:hypothetical protein
LLEYEEDRSVPLIDDDATLGSLGIDKDVKIRVVGGATALVTFTCVFCSLCTQILRSICNFTPLHLYMRCRRSASCASACGTWTADTRCFPWRRTARSRS